MWYRGFDIKKERSHYGLGSYYMVRWRAPSGRLYEITPYAETLEECKHYVDTYVLSGEWDGILSKVISDYPTDWEEFKLYKVEQILGGE